MKAEADAPGQSREEEGTFYKEFFDQSLHRILPAGTDLPMNTRNDLWKDNADIAGEYRKLLSFLSSNASLHHYLAKEILISQNAPQHSLYFLLHGAIRCYYLDPSTGHEVTNNLIIVPGSIGIAGPTFVDGVGAMDWIQAIEDTDMIEIPLKKLAGAVPLPLFSQLAQAAEGQSIRAYKKLMEVRSLDVQARCDWLHKTHPELEARVQKQYLASFLDMDKAVYSRCIRNRKRC